VNSKKCDHYWAASDYLPVTAVLDYWCGNNYECKEAKKFAIITACEKGLIKYKRTDGKDFHDPVLDLIGRGIIVIERKSFEEWSKRIDNNAALNLPIGQRAEKTYLNIIGALLECITGQFKDQEFSSEAELKNFIDEKFDDLKGVRERTLSGKFALAKKALNDEL